LIYRRTNIVSDKNPNSLNLEQTLSSQNIERKYAITKEYLDKKL